MNSKDVIFKVATELGFIKEDNLNFIPETVGALNHVAEAATGTIFQNPTPDGVSAEVIRKAFCYVFAKGIESVSLWDDSSNGEITLSFVEEDLLNGLFGVGVSEETENVITAAMIAFPDVFFYAYQEWIIEQQDDFQNGKRDLFDEIQEALTWTARFGSSLALSL